MQINLLSKEMLFKFIEAPAVRCYKIIKAGLCLIVINFELYTRMFFRSDPDLIF